MPPPRPPPATALNARETLSRLALAVALVALGRPEEAKAVVTEARRMDQGLTVASFDSVVGQEPHDLRQRVYSALRQVGLS